MIYKYDVELTEGKLPQLIQRAQIQGEEPSLTDAAAVASMLDRAEGISRKAEEHLYMIGLDAKGSALAVLEVAHGTICSCLASPREIFLRALLCGSCYVIVVHNHPSGDEKPSEMDNVTYRKIREAGELLAIRLVDFIVVAYGGAIYSFAEHGHTL